MGLRDARGPRENRASERGASGINCGYDTRLDIGIWDGGSVHNAGKETSKE